VHDGIRSQSKITHTLDNRVSILLQRKGALAVDHPLVEQARVQYAVAPALTGQLDVLKFDWGLQTACSDATIAADRRRFEQYKLRVRPDLSQ
jgi:hypothetical protein